MVNPGARGVWALCDRLSLTAKGRSDPGRLSADVKSARNWQVDICRLGQIICEAIDQGPIGLVISGS